MNYSELFYVNWTCFSRVFGVVSILHLLFLWCTFTCTLPVSRKRETIWTRWNNPILLSYFIKFDFMTNIQCHISLDESKFLFLPFHAYTGPIRWILTLSVFRVPSRLTYTAYLVHPIVVLFIALGSQNPILLDDLHLVSPVLSYKT